MPFPVTHTGAKKGPRSGTLSNLRFTWHITNLRK